MTYIYQNSRELQLRFPCCRGACCSPESAVKHYSYSSVNCSIVVSRVVRLCVLYTIAFCLGCSVAGGTTSYPLRN